MSTREVVDALYAAFLAGDGEGMIELMADDVEVTFLGQGTFHGIPAVLRFMSFSAGLLQDVDFRIRTVIIDRDVGSAIWEESVTTRDGKPWFNHGVDVIRVGETDVESHLLGLRLQRGGFERGLLHRHLDAPAIGDEVAAGDERGRDRPHRLAARGADFNQIDLDETHLCLRRSHLLLRVAHRRLRFEACRHASFGFLQ